MGSSRVCGLVRRVGRGSSAFIVVIAVVSALTTGFGPLGPREAQATTSYDAAAEFSATSNPSGTWLYGWSTAPGQAVHIDLNRTNVSGIDIWYEPRGDPIVPGVFHNGTNGTINAFGASFAPGELALHPGPTGDNAVVRWTAPVTGTFAVDATFKGINMAGPTTDVNVLVKDTGQLFSDFVNGYGTTRTFSRTVTFAAGEAIDFTVGFGSNSNYGSDMTGLDVTIEQVTVAGAERWDLAEDLLANAASSYPTNPYADSHGIANTWHMLSAQTTSRIPSTYSLLGPYVSSTCGQAGLSSWGAGAGGTYVNTTGATITGISCALGVVLPPHQAFAHPGSANLMMFAWESPIAGTVTIEGGFTDADCAGGNGVAWFVDKGATDLASGVIGNCGSQSIPSGLTASVTVGDYLFFIVDPNGATLNQFDMTELDVTILADTTPPTITGAAAPPPNANGWNNTPVTVSFTCSDSG